MNIYKIDQAGYWTGEHVDSEDGGCPAGWVRATPPTLAAGEYAVWSGRWSVVTEPPPSEWPAAIAARRYQEETKGTDMNGTGTSTSRESQSLITGAALQATIDSTYTCCWKTASGFIDLSAQQILNLATAVRAHVQACFDREAVLLDAVTAGTFTPDMLEQGWPQ